MNASREEEYLRELDGMVMDEEKIVTFKLLSRILGLNVNIAKQLLHVYLLKHQKSSPCPVSATHLLAGSLKDGTFLVSIVTDEKLNDTYEKYDKITSEHVYSIQKGKSSSLEKNGQVLFAANSSLPPPKSYPIKYHKVLAEKTEDRRTKNTVQSIEVKDEMKSDEKEKKPSKSSPRKEEKPATKKPGHISNFFNNQSQRRKEPEKEEKAEVKNEIDQIEEESSKVLESEIREISISDEETSAKPSTSNERQKKERVKKKKKKKRKRIMSASEDSESDEEKRDAALCAEPEAEETTKRLRISDDDDDDDDQEDLFARNRKRRKVVERTVLRDDGFMETYKEAVYESESDGESTKPKKKSEAKEKVTSGRKVEKEESPKKKTKTTKTSPGTTNPKKQPTLFSFFKKN